MKKIIFAICILTLFSITLSSCAPMTGLIDNYFSSALQDAFDENPDTTVWSINNGTLRLSSLAMPSDKDDEYFCAYGFRMEDLVPGKYTISWILKESLLDLGVNYFSGPDTEKAAVYFNSDPNTKSPGGGSTATVLLFDKTMDIRLFSYTFEVGASRGFQIYMLNIYSDSLSSCLAIKDNLQSNYFTKAILTKVG